MTEKLNIPYDLKGVPLRVQNMSYMAKPAQLSSRVALTISSCPMATSIGVEKYCWYLSLAVHAKAWFWYSKVCLGAVIRSCSLSKDTFWMSSSFKSIKGGLSTNCHSNCLQIVTGVRTFSFHLHDNEEIALTLKITKMNKNT